MFTLVFNRAMFFLNQNPLVGHLPSLGISSPSLVSGHLPVSSAFRWHYQLNGQDLCRYHSILTLPLVLLDLSFLLPFCM